MIKHRLILPLAFAFLLTACAGKTIHLVTENNTPLGCVDVLQVSPASTPPAILKGVQACIAEQQYDKAAALAMLGNAYGRYDALRVADTSAHQALTVLNMFLLQNATPEQRTGFLAAHQKLAEAGSPSHQQVCQNIINTGVPKYYPKYMINHGAKAYNNALSGSHIASADLVADYEPNIMWPKVLKENLNCL